MRRLAVLGIAAAAAVAAADGDGVMPMHDPVWRMRWDERMAAFSDAELLSGTTRQPRPVRPGAWGGAALGAAWSRRGRRGPLPGLPPLPDRPELTAELDLDIAWHFAWLHLALDGGLAADSGRRSEPPPDARADWTGSAADAGRGMATGTVEVEAGVRSDRQVLLAGNRPFGWGPGIFGGVVFGRGSRGFPHAALESARPWQLGLYDGEPVVLAHQTVVGAPDGGDAGPDLVGQNLDLRIGMLECGARVAWLGGIAPGSADLAAGAIDASVLMWGALRVSAECGVRRATAGRPPDTIERSLAWVATIDLVDPFGDGLSRLAVEWHRAAPAIDLPRAWEADDEPLAHADGPGAESLRLLVQQRSEAGSTFGAVAGVRSSGFDNALGAPPTARRPSRAWTTWSLDARLEQPLGDAAGPTAEFTAGGAFENNPRYRRDQEFVFSAGAGLRWRL